MVKYWEEKDYNKFTKRGKKQLKKDRAADVKDTNSNEASLGWGPYSYNFRTRQSFGPASPVRRIDPKTYEEENE